MNDDTQTTRDLVDRSRSGDPRALEELLIAFVPELQAFCRLNMGDQLEQRETSEDLVQSACREVLGALADFEYRGPAQFRKWLFLHVLRKIQQRGRFWKRERRAANELPLDEREPVADYSRAFSPSQVAMRREEVEQLEAAFEQLSEEQRQVLTMSRFLDMTSQEIGEQLGKEPGTVRVTLHRAMARLTVLLDGQG